MLDNIVANLHSKLEPLTWNAKTWWARDYMVSQNRLVFVTAEKIRKCSTTFKTWMICSFTDTEESPFTFDTVHLSILSQMA